MISSKEHKILQFVCNTNIEKFTERLANTNKQNERDQLLKLLTEEKAKLLALVSQEAHAGPLPP